jgi:2-succinyl-6-hydroxy-2,4-cyclohexadiene-1-carboxylate synthase
MSKINIRGIEHFYELIPTPEDNSDDPVLVFIHGWLLSHRYWLPLIEQLSSYYSCLVYDLRGFGQSQPVLTKPIEQDTLSNYPLESSKSPYSLYNYAQDLKVLLHQLNIKKAWLIGHSLGGSIAIWGADICGEIIEGVICVNAGGGIYLPEEFERFRNAGKQLVKFRPSWLKYIPFLKIFFALTMVDRPLELKWGQARLEDFLGADREAATGSLLDSTTEEEVHYLPQIVARLKQPVYFWAGKQDMIMQPQYVHHLASFHQLFTHHNQQNVWELNDCGHFAMLEQTERLQIQILEIMKKDKFVSCENVTIE